MSWQRVSPVLAALVLFADALTFSSRPKISDVETGSYFQSKRRQMLFQGLISPLVAATVPTQAFAIGEGDERMIFKQKPTAPIEALVPAIQQRLLLEVALDLLKASPEKSTIDTESLQKLKMILPPLDETPQFKNQNGSQNTKVLKKFPPDKALRGDAIRAVMNVYQLNLNYDALLNMNNPNDAISITDPEWKRSYIRKNDGLPDIEKVVGADIDMRQLLRNQVQLKVDDAAAELWSDDCDVQELTSLLQEAASNFDLWLDRVRDGDVREALAVAQGKQ